MYNLNDWINVTFEKCSAFFLPQKRTILAHYAFNVNILKNWTLTQAARQRGIIKIIIRITTTITILWAYILTKHVSYSMHIFTPQKQQQREACFICEQYI